MSLQNTLASLNSKNEQTIKAVIKAINQKISKTSGNTKSNENE